MSSFSCSYMLCRACFGPGSSSSGGQFDRNEQRRDDGRPLLLLERSVCILSSKSRENSQSERMRAGHAFFDMIGPLEPRRHHWDTGRGAGFSRRGFSPILPLHLPFFEDLHPEPSCMRSVSWSMPHFRQAKPTCKNSSPALVLRYASSHYRVSHRISQSRTP